MSFKATDWAYGLRELSGPEKAVLLCLAWHHNQKTGLCCPGNQLIADETCLGLSTVKKALAALIGKGLVSRYPWRGRSAYMLAITETPEATTEPAHIEQEETKKAKASNWDWKKTQPAPLLEGRARAEKRAAEFKAAIEPAVKDRGTPEEREAFLARVLGRPIQQPTAALPQSADKTGLPPRLEHPAPVEPVAPSRQQSPHRSPCR